PGVRPPSFPPRLSSPALCAEVRKLAAWRGANADPGKLPLRQHRLHAHVGAGSRAHPRARVRLHVLPEAWGRVDLQSVRRAARRAARSRWRLPVRVRHRVRAIPRVRPVRRRAAGDGRDRRPHLCGGEREHVQRRESRVAHPRGHLFRRRDRGGAARALEAQLDPRREVRRGGPMTTVEDMSMQIELYYLVLSTAFTAVLWVPYVLDRFMIRGIAGTVGYPESPKPASPWAERLKAAHGNAVENLVVFA